MSTRRVASSTHDDEHELTTERSRLGEEARDALASGLDVVMMEIERRHRRPAQTRACARGQIGAVAGDEVLFALDAERGCVGG